MKIVVTLILAIVLLAIAVVFIGCWIGYLYFKHDPANICMSFKDFKKAYDIAPSNYILEEAYVIRKSSSGGHIWIFFRPFDLIFHYTPLRYCEYEAIRLEKNRSEKERLDGLIERDIENTKEGP